MQTVPLMRTFPEELHKIWPSNNVQHYLPEDLELVTENLGRPRGSCCDDGRHMYDQCGDQTNRWYVCAKFGLPNITTWMRIGETGFTMPLSTEHRGVCEYSERKTLCKIPKTCRARVPHIAEFKSSGGAVALEAFNKCNEMPIVRHFGFYNASAPVVTAPVRSTLSYKAKGKSVSSKTTGSVVQTDTQVEALNAKLSSLEKRDQVREAESDKLKDELNALKKDVAVLLQHASGEDVQK
eukprot:gene44525-55397_t